VSTENLAMRRQEFDAHLWNHSTDAFQMAFDDRRALADDEVEALEPVLAILREGGLDGQVARALQRALSIDPRLVYIIMQLVGLTRNKILNDLKAATVASEVKVPSSPENLHRRPAVWELAGPYLARRLRTVLGPIASLGTSNYPAAIEALNQATWPGWIRQERAKRQGHEAEGRLATLLASLDIPFQPEAKADNPLCPDVIVQQVSFDLVVPSAAEMRLCLKSTVQTSNIGQFGESKGALEVVEAIHMLREHYGHDRPQLLAMVDGIGFRSNRAGLDGILTGADEFCQFATIWKAAVIAADAVGARVALDLPDAEEHGPFLRRYRGAVIVKSGVGGDPEAVVAGEASVVRV
jgi:hypothetical protein